MTINNNGFLEDLTSDFEDLKLNKPGDFCYGISKLRESYLEASKDVLNLLKVLENEQVADPAQIEISVSKQNRDRESERNGYFGQEREADRRLSR